MAGWDLLQQPYHRGPPVEPQIPKFDPTAVQLISHGTDTAVRALLGGIELGQRNRLEKEKMAQDLALTTEGHMIQRENNVLDYNIQRGNMDISRDYHGVMNDLHRAQTGIAKEKLAEMRGGIGMGMDFATSVGAYRQDFQQRANELGMYDGRVQSNPGAMAMAIDILSREFPGAVTATGIPNQLAEWRAQNNAQQMPIGDKFHSPSEIIAMLKNPDTHDAVYEALLEQSSGGTEVKVHEGRKLTNFFGLFGQTSTKRIPNEKLQALEDAAKKYHPELIKPRIPRGMPRTEKTFNRAVQTGAMDPGITPQPGQGLPSPDVPTATPGPTPTDFANPSASPGAEDEAMVDAEYVKRVSRERPDKADQLRAIFLGKFPGKEALLAE